MGYAIYCRISRDAGGEGHGVARQESECRQLAEAYNLNIKQVFTDNDISAFSGVNRPAYNEMLQKVEAGEFKGIICWHVDRLYRRTRDLEEIVDLVERTNIEIRTVNAGDLDLNTATGRVTARLVAAIANYEVDHMMERMKSSQIQRASKGLYRGGRVLYGYKRTDTPGVLEFSHPEVDHVRFMADAVLAGDSLLSVSRRLVERGVTTKTGKAWSTRQIRNILLSPTIAGIVARHGEEIGPGQWPAIVSEDEFRAMQSILTDPSRVTHQGNEKRWQGSGTYVCGACGGRIKASISHTRTGERRRGYKCYECKKVFRDQGHVDNLIDELVIGYLSKPENQLTIIKGGGSSSDDVGTLIQERNQVVERRTGMGLLFARGQINEAQLVSGTAELDRRIVELDKQITRARQDSPLLELVLGADDLRERWNHLSADKRSEIIKLLMNVKIMPAGRGGKFNPDLIKIEWKE